MGRSTGASRGAWIGAGIAALAAYGFVATLQDDSNFGRILGAGICLLGVAVGVIMFAPRSLPEVAHRPAPYNRGTGRLLPNLRRRESCRPPVR